MDTLLIEIGSEEIPAGYIEPALKAFSSLMTQRLAHLRIEHGTARVFGTPRRLTVEITDVADAQTPLVTEITGPPKKVGFDDAGKPTMAAVKFAEKAGVGLDEIRIKETEKRATSAPKRSNRACPPGRSCRRCCRRSSPPSRSPSA
jgi:glycyl-tRNA synthetase beta chain